MLWIVLKFIVKSCWLNYENKSCWRIAIALLIRASAISYDSLSFSMPINWKPSCIAATPVLPEPMNGSKMTPLGGVIRRQR